MTFDELVRVWTPASALGAIVGGVIYGLAVGFIATNPNYSAGLVSAFRIGLLTAFFAASGGLIFFALQALGSYIAHDPLWFRVMSRYGQWVLFSATIGFTTWHLVRRDRIRRKRAAHDRALEDLAAQGLIDPPYGGEGDH